MTSPSAVELAGIPLFASLSDRELQATAQLLTVRSFPNNAIVATEGDRLDLFNIILSGKIQFFWCDEGGYQVKLGIDGPGGHYADVTLGGADSHVRDRAREPAGRLDTDDGAEETAAASPGS